MESNSSNADGYEAASLNTLCLRSRKRSLELFLGIYESATSGLKPAPEDTKSLQIKLSSKINDEFGGIKDLPPPASVVPNPTPKTSNSAISSTSSNQGGVVQTKILGPNAFPSRPGVQSEEGESTEELLLPESDDYQNIINSIPKSKQPSQAYSIVEYQKAANKDRSIPSGGTSRAIVNSSRNPYEDMKPDWHAPWKLMRVISGHLGWVRCMSIDPSNEWFVTGSADRTIKIWDLASGVLKLTLTGHINTVRGLAVSPRHPYLFSAGEDKKVLCWDLEYNKVIRHYHGHLSGVYCLDMHPTLDVLVSGGRDSTARVWDMRTKQNIFVLSGHNNTVGSVVCQASEPQIVTGSQDSTIRFWDLAKGACSTVLTHHKKSVRALAVHPSEYAMLSGSPDNIKKWKFPEGKFLHNFSGHNSIVNTLAINKDNVVFSGADNGTMWFWDWKTGYGFQKLQTTVQPGSLESEAGIYCSMFDVTSSRLIVGEADKTIKIYKEDETATQETHPIVDWKPQRQTNWGK